MAIEYERRFLVSAQLSLPDDAQGTLIVQGYPWQDAGHCVRIRRQFRGDIELPSSIAYKGPRRAGQRQEDEIYVPRQAAQAMLRSCPAKVIKIRHQVIAAGHAWDVDVFLWANNGLRIAEAEGDGPVTFAELPPWCLEEVTGDRRYDNEQLAIRPFQTW
jgi:CYTH domain-containing protein